MTSTPSIWPSSRSSLVVKSVYAGPRRPRMWTSVIFLLRQGLQHPVGHVGVGELVGGLDQHPGHVQGHVADADDDGFGRSREQVVDHHGRPLMIKLRDGVGVHIGVAAVPGHQIRGAQAAGQILARDAHLLVRARPVRVDDGVDRAAQLLEREVAPDGDVPVEAHPRLLQRPLQGVPDGPDRGVVGRDTVADQSERHRQPVDHRHLNRDIGLLAQRLGGVDARRTGSDDGDHEGWSVGARPRGVADQLTGRARPRERSCPQPRGPACSAGLAPETASDRRSAGAGSAPGCRRRAASATRPACRAARRPARGSAGTRW